MKGNIPEAHANPLVREIGKPAEDFDRKDLIGLIRRRGIKSIHFRYPAADGKLKELKLPVNDLSDAEAVLAEGERVDGSSLFKGMVDAGKSDLYVLPVYRTAFLSPFAPDSLELICRYLDGKGQPAAFTPDNILARADESFTKASGCSLHALGELEFYVIYPDDRELYPGRPQGAYHEAAPYSRFDEFLEQVLRLSSEICGGVKYCHSEVGCVASAEDALPEFRGMRMVQYELEFLPAPLQETAGRLLAAKWIIRNLAAKRGLLVSFAPKLSLGDAGSGLHIHMLAQKQGRNVMLDAKGVLSDDARGIIGGLLRRAGSLTAFGNTCAASYLRLVPHQEAPVRVCWSGSNRSVLVRVPLGWRGVDNLASRVNPRQKPDYKGDMFGQTVELRSPDGSADLYLLLAGIACAAREGWSRREESLALAREAEVSTNVFDDPVALSRLKTLPCSCAESAALLESERSAYEAEGVFTPAVLDFCRKRLEAEKDRQLSQDLVQMGEDGRKESLRRVVAASLHCM